MASSPEFTVPAECLYTLDSPSDFYALLLAGCGAAERRVTLSSLYFGTGPLERYTSVLAREHWPWRRGLAPRLALRRALSW
jgi:hypothetical protein